MGRLLPDWHPRSWRQASDRSRTVLFVNARIMTDAGASSIRIRRPCWRSTSRRARAIRRRPRRRVRAAGADQRPRSPRAESLRPAESRDRIRNATEWIDDLRRRSATIRTIRRAAAHPLAERLFIGGAQEPARRASPRLLITTRSTAQLARGSPPGRCGASGGRTRCRCRASRSARTARPRKRA